MTTSQNKRIHLDSSVYIAFLKGETIPAYNNMSRVSLAKLIFDGAEAGEVSLFTSTVSLVEVRRGENVTQESESEVFAKIDALFSRSSTQFVELDRDVAISARLLAVRYGLPLMDAVQVASALRVGCHEAFFWDMRIVRKFGNAPLPNLLICEPYWSGQLSL